ncbi:hypothetical protein HID58_086225 [Brassica napus]|uniref:Uncharacterized protein n=1 Tax=Brassica napus TaxID=3708 RepID=A0ABQ7XPX4_BRANA|nr:hypothetical protein HID58_086225 [Brassica napus]
MTLHLTSFLLWSRKFVAEFCLINGKFASITTERRARIERVKQGIADSAAEASVRITRITNELDKGKCHVFSYQDDTLVSKKQRPLLLGAYSEGYVQSLEEGEADSSATNGSFTSAPTAVLSGFQLGPSSGGRVSGNQNASKTQRKRPPSWKRKPNTSRAQASYPAPSQHLNKAKRNWCGAEEDDSCTVARIARCRQDIAKWKHHTSFNSKDKITRLKLDLEQEAPVDLTLKVSDLIDVHSGQWIVPRVRETFSPDDVRLVLNTKINPSCHNNTIWCFTKSGQYSSKSGYKLLEVWSLSGIPPPTAGYSQTSMFLFII